MRNVPTCCDTHDHAPLHPYTPPPPPTPHPTPPPPPTYTHTSLSPPYWLSHTQLYRFRHQPTLTTTIPHTGGTLSPLLSQVSIWQLTLRRTHTHQQKPICANRPCTQLSLEGRMHISLARARPLSVGGS